MATITLNLDERTIKNGMAQVRIRISHKGTNCFIGSGVYVEPKYFQPYALHDAVNRRAVCAVEKRERISEQVQLIEDYLENISKDALATMTANDIRDHAMCVTKKKAYTKASTSVQSRVENTSSTDGDFMRWFDEYGDSRRTWKTRDSYYSCGRVLRQYCDSRRLLTLRFDDMDYARLGDFARWLRNTGRSEGTRHIYESYIRAAYKEAQKRHMVSRDNDPYYDYSIAPVPPKDIETLTAQEMHALMIYEPKLMGLQRARDIALMSFMLCGANLLDVYLMDAPKHGEVSFVRHKVEAHNQREIHIRLEPELKALVERHKGDGSLLRFKDEFPNYESFRHKIYHRLRDMNDDLGFDVSLAKIRRTWATIAASIGVQEWVIDKSMGHVDSTITRRNYARYDWSHTAEANRRVLDAVLNA